MTTRPRNTFKQGDQPLTGPHCLQKLDGPHCSLARMPCPRTLAYALAALHCLYCCLQKLHRQHGSPARMARPSRTLPYGVFVGQGQDGMRARGTHSPEPKKSSGTSKASWSSNSGICRLLCVFFGPTSIRPTLSTSPTAFRWCWPSEPKELAGTPSCG